MFSHKKIEGYKIKGIKKTNQDYSAAMTLSLLMQLKPFKSFETGSAGNSDTFTDR